MEQDLQKIIEDRFKELPTTIREVITESGWEKNIRNIVAKHNLRIDQGAVIEHETLLIMLGFETPEDYITNLINEARVDTKVAEAIAQDVNEQIFSLIREKIIEKTEEENAIQTEKEQTGEYERDAILKEIDDKDETELMIRQSSLPSTQIATPTPNQSSNTQPQIIIPVTNSVNQKLQSPTVSTAKTVKIDPYREIPE